MTANFSSERPESSDTTFFKHRKRRTSNSESYIQQKYSSGIKEKSKHLQKKAN